MVAKVVAAVAALAALAAVAQWPGEEATTDETDESGWPVSSTPANAGATGATVMLLSLPPNACCAGRSHQHQRLVRPAHEGVGGFDGTGAEQLEPRRVRRGSGHAACARTTPAIRISGQRHAGCKTVSCCHGKDQLGCRAQWRRIPLVA